MAKCECNKRHVSLVWALLECIFFTGLVFGWTWLSATLRRDGYFLDFCNMTLKSEKYLDQKIEGHVLQSKAEQPQELNMDPLTNVENSRVRVKKQRRKKCRKKKIPTTTPDPSENVILWKINDTQYFCDEQENNLELMNAIVLIMRNAMILPIGFFLDSYGTTRTRLLSVLAFVMGTLMMTFSSSSFPWIIIPAFSLLSWAGLVILVTNLQVANLFSNRRYTIISSLIGCFHASSVILHLVKLTQYDIEIQTSFMFLTIGVIPILVSTIAFLPKSRIPWPLPASYGKRGCMVKDNSSNSRHSKKVREELQTFVRFARSSLFIWSVVWYCIYHLRSFTYDGNLRYMLIKYGVPKDEVHEYTDLYALIQMIALPIGPLIGYFIDWRRVSTYVSSPWIQQMHSTLMLIGLTFLLALANNIIPTIPSVSLQVAGFCFQIIERVAVLTSLFGFLMHVHFPVEHFGKLMGFHFTMSSIISLLRFPLQKFVISSLQGDPFYINLLLLVFLLISCGHPVNIWYHCKLGLINDTSNMIATQAASERLMAARPSECEVEITQESIQHS